MVKETLVLIGKTSFKVISSFLLIFLPFVVINLLFIAFTGKSIFENLNTFWAVSVLIIFIAGFPFLYFWLAKKTAVKKGLNYLINTNKVVLIEYILRKVFTQINDKVIDKSNVKKYFSGTDSVLKRMKTAPRPVRWVLNSFINKIPFSESIAEFVEENPIDIDSLDDKGKALAEKINEKVDLSLFDEKSYHLLALIAVNFIAILLTSLYLV